MNKEQIYDTQINPLLTQIIAICQEHGIAMIANFACPYDGNADLQVVTMIPDENKDHPKNHVAALACIRRKQGGGFSITTTAPDGSKTLSTFLG